MSKAVPWSIDDVGADARDAAKMAARRAGLSLGDWVDEIVADRAAELGVEESDVDAHERKAAVAAELARVPLRPSAFVSGDRSAVGGAVGPGRAIADPARGRFRSGNETAGERRTDAFPEPTPPHAGTPRGSSPRFFQEAGGPGPFRLAEPSRADDSFMRSAVAEIARRQADLDAQSPIASPQDAGPLPSGPFTAAATAGRPAAAAGSTRMRAAGAKGTTEAGTRAFKPGPVTVAELQDAVAALEARIAQGGAPQTAGRTQASDRSSYLAALDRDRVAADQGQGTPPARAAVESLRDADAQVADTPKMLNFEKLAQDLRRAIEGIDARPSVRSLDSQVQALGLKVEGMTASLAGGETLTRVDAQTRELRDLLAQAAQRAVPSDTVGRQMAALEARVGALSTDRRRPSEPDPTLTEIRDLLDRFRPGATLASLESRIDALASKLDGGSSTGSPLAVMEDLARRVDASHTALRSQLAEGRVDTRPLENLVRGVADRIDDARRASSDLQGLETAVRELVAKLGDGGSRIDPGTLDAQFAKLERRLDQSESGVAALDAVEHSLGALFNRLDETRNAAVEAAENAARTAARDTLRAAMQNPAVAQRPIEAHGGLIEQVSQEFADLRGMQSASDQRLQGSLANLNRTIERLAEQFSAVTRAGQPGEKARAELGAAADGATVVVGAVGARRRGDKPDAAPAIRIGDEARRSREQASADAVEERDPADMLIEPGSRGGALRGVVRQADDVKAPQRGKSPAAGSPDVEPDGPASFIAAARRAAQAAQASAARTRRPGPHGRDTIAARSGNAASTIARARSFLVQRRRPILLSIAGLVLVLGALEVARVSMGSEGRANLGAIEAAGASARGLPSAAPSPDARDAGIVGGPTAKQDAALPSGQLSAESSAKDPAVAALALPTGVPGGTRATAGVATWPAPGADPAPNGLGEGLRAKAAAGDAAAQYEVALRLADGRTVTRDPKLAATWFEKAASQGFAPAQYRLGSAYEKGIGVSRDAALASAWYGRAADAGNIRAMHNLAVMAAEGAAGKPDYAKAATWFGKAAGYGVRDSQFNLAILRARGLGVEQSLAEAYTWFAIAAGQGDEDAAKKRDEVGQHLDAKTLTGAKAAAEAFRPAVPNATANEVLAPPGGWDALPAPPRPGPPTGKAGAPKVSAL